MKQICVTLLLATIFTTVNGQIKRNSVLLGGQLSFDQQKSDYNFNNSPSESTNRSKTFGLSAGLAFKRNFIVGLKGGFSVGKITFTENGNARITETTQYEAGIFLREYKQLLRKFYFFSEIDAVASYYKSEGTPLYGMQTKEKGAQVGFTPGLSYQVLKRMHLEIAILDIVGVSYSKATNDQPDPQPDSHVEKISIFSSFNNENKTLGGVGIGLRFIL